MRATASPGACRTYPHTDQIATAERAADLLERTMRGMVKPRCVIARRPIYPLDQDKHHVAGT